MTRLRALLLLIGIGVLVVPPLLAWRHASSLERQASSARSRLVQTRSAVETITRRRASVSPDASGTFGQADAVRLVNSALVEAGLSPSAASELSLRDDPIRRQGRDAGRLQRLSIRLAPLETPQLGRVLAELERALPSFTAAEINLVRPSNLDESDTRFGIDLAYEREYSASPEARTP